MGDNSCSPTDNITTSQILSKQKVPHGSESSFSTVTQLIPVISLDTVDLSKLSSPQTFTAVPIYVLGSLVSQTEAQIPVSSSFTSVAAVNSVPYNKIASASPQPTNSSSCVAAPTANEIVSNFIQKQHEISQKSPKKSLENPLHSASSKRHNAKAPSQCRQPSSAKCKAKVHASSAKVNQLPQADATCCSSAAPLSSASPSSSSQDPVRRSCAKTAPNGGIKTKYLSNQATNGLRLLDQPQQQDSLSGLLQVWLANMGFPGIGAEATCVAAIHDGAGGAQSNCQDHTKLLCSQMPQTSASASYRYTFTLPLSASNSRSFPLTLFNSDPVLVPNCSTSTQKTAVAFSTTDVGAVINNGNFKQFNKKRPISSCDNVSTALCVSTKTKAALLEKLKQRKLQNSTKKDTVEKQNFSEVGCGVPGAVASCSIMPTALTVLPKKKVKIIKKKSLKPQPRVAKWDRRFVNHVCSEACLPVQAHAACSSAVEYEPVSVDFTSKATVKFADYMGSFRVGVLDRATLTPSITNQEIVRRARFSKNCLSLNSGCSSEMLNKHLPKSIQRAKRRASDKALKALCGTKRQKSSDVVKNSFLKPEFICLLDETDECSSSATELMSYCGDDTTEFLDGDMPRSMEHPVETAFFSVLDDRVPATGLESEETECASGSSEPLAVSLFPSLLTEQSLLQSVQNTADTSQDKDENADIVTAECSFQSLSTYPCGFEPSDDESDFELNNEELGLALDMPTDTMPSESPNLLGHQSSSDSHHQSSSRLSSKHRKVRHCAKGIWFYRSYFPPSGPYLSDPANEYVSEKNCRDSQTIRFSEVQRDKCFDLPRSLGTSNCRDCHTNFKSNDLCRFQDFRRVVVCRITGRPMSTDSFMKSSDNYMKSQFFLPSSAAVKGLDLESACYILQNVLPMFDWILDEELKSLKLALKMQCPGPFLKPLCGIRELCDLCDATIFNLHFMCVKCGFAVCLQCFMRRMKRYSIDQRNDWASPKVDRFGWSVCTSNGSLHDPTRLSLGQMIADCWSRPLSTLHSLNLSLHRVVDEFRVPQGCGCPPANEVDNKEDEVNGHCYCAKLTPEVSSSSASTTPGHSFACSENVLLIADSKSPNVLPLFQKHWKTFKPIVISGINRSLNKKLWTPDAFLAHFEEEIAYKSVQECRGGGVFDDFRVKDFWLGFSDPEQRQIGTDGLKLTLKLKDWPNGGRFAEVMPEHAKDLCNALPVPEYTHSDFGKLNLVTRLPVPMYNKPDLGPKMYNAYEMSMDEEKGTTNLHMDVSDAVNLLVYVACPQKDNREEYYEKLKERVAAICGDETSNRRVGEKPENVGALWTIFHPEDSERIREFLTERAKELKLRLSANSDPVHDQLCYIDKKFRDELKENYGVQPYCFVQMLGDAVFIPAGAAHQVHNLQCCIKAAQDFVTPEGVLSCSRIAKEFRRLSRSHTNHEDKLQLENIIYHAVKDCTSYLLRKLVDPAAEDVPFDTADVQRAVDLPAEFPASFYCEETDNGTEEACYSKKRPRTSDEPERLFYTENFKKKVAQYAHKEGTKAAHLHFNISTSSISRWMEQYKQSKRTGGKKMNVGKEGTMLHELKAVANNHCDGVHKSCEVSIDGNLQPEGSSAMDRETTSDCSDKDYSSANCSTTLESVEHREVDKEEVAAYAEHHGQKAAVQHFNVSLSSVKRWKKQYNTQGGHAELCRPCKVTIERILKSSLSVDPESTNVSCSSSSISDSESMPTDVVRRRTKTSLEAAGDAVFPIFPIKELAQEPGPKMNVSSDTTEIVSSNPGTALTKQSELPAFEFQNTTVRNTCESSPNDPGGQNGDVNLQQSTPVLKEN